MLELSELYVLTFNIGTFCPPKALPSGGGRPPGRWTGRVPSLCILVTPEIFLPQKSEGNLASGDNLAQNSARPVEAARTCTHKIAIGDSDLINVRLGPLCGLESDISRGPRSANSGREQAQQCVQENCVYSIISSATVRKLSDRLRPSALAVLRLITSSNLVGR